MAPAKAAIEGLNKEVVVAGNLVGKDEGYQAVANTYEAMRLLVVKIEDGRQDPWRSETIRKKERKGKLSFVKATSSEPSKDIGKLLKEAKDLRMEITGRGNPDMPLPAPLSMWLKQNDMQNKWE